MLQRLLTFKLRLIVVAVALVIALVFGLLVVVGAFLGADTEESSSESEQCSAAPPPGAPGPVPKAPKEIRKQQVQNAKLIDEAAQDLGLSGRASRLAIITAHGESTLINLGYGDDIKGVKNPDGSATTSLGLFQQQTSMGWGTREQVMNPKYAATSFFRGPGQKDNGGLLNVEGWETRGDISQVIHEVQGNKDPNHYTKSIQPADDVIDEAGIDVNRGMDLSKFPTAHGEDHEHGNAEEENEYFPLRNCLTEDNKNTPEVINPELLGSGEWGNPLPASSVTSKFGYRGCFIGVVCNEGVKFHKGLDLDSGTPGAPVYAPTDMTVTKVVGPGGYWSEYYGTHIFARMVDSPGYVFEFHHLVHGSAVVKDGQVIPKGTKIGTEGSTGNSTGAHLHFQINDPSSPDKKPSPQLSVDPAPILKGAGITDIAW